MAGDKEKPESSDKLAGEEEMLGELKREQSGAQSALTRKANILTRTANSSTEEKLKAEWDKFGSEYCNLISANTDYIEALSEADTEASRQQANNVGKMAEDCDQRFAEVEQEVKLSFWSRFALLELAPLARRAERAMDQAERIEVKRETFGLCERQNNYLRESIEKTNEKLASWKAWIPATHASELGERVVSLTDRRESLWLQWEQEFSDSKSRAEDRRTANVAEWETATRSEDSVNAPPNPSGEPPASTERSAQPGSASVPPGTAGRSVAVGVPQGAVPKVHVARIRLPTFTGCMRSFYPWRCDWESLQRQGEPSGSPEIKKLYLLDSLDGKIKQNLGLSNSRSADEIFRLLENRYGNKGTIACQIIEEVDKFPAIKGNQPRTTIDLIQAVERALFDLIDLGEEDALKQGFSKCGKVSLPSENIRTAAPPLPINIIIIIVVAIMQGYYYPVECP